MIGQKATAVVLHRMVETDRVPSGLLFSGVRGSGKTSAARILASSLDAGDVIEVDAASKGSVTDVRDMIEMLRYSSGGSKRVVIYDEAHSMSKEAFNALLKTLEEPPAGVIFVLVTTEPEKIPATVKSRLMEFVFRRVSVAEISERLDAVAQREGVDASPELIAFLAERADGSVRDALMMLDQCHRADISTKSSFLNLAGERDVAPILVRAMLTGDHAYIFETVDELSQRVPDPSKLVSGIVGVLKDVLVLRAGGKVSASPAGLTARSELAKFLEPERVLAAMRLLWDLKTKARQSTDPRGNLDLALVLVSEVLTRGREGTVNRPARSSTQPVVPVPQEPEVQRKLSLDEL